MRLYKLLPLVPLLLDCAQPVGQADEPDAHVSDAGHDASDAANVDAPDDSDVDAMDEDMPELDTGVIDAGAVDAKPVCGKFISYSIGGPDGGCTVGIDYTCANTIYTIDCNCPDSTCGCYANGQTVKMVAFNGCPTCTQPKYATVAQLCGIPVP
jgi:hypothetical protein